MLFSLGGGCVVFFSGVCLTCRVIVLGALILD